MSSSPSRRGLLVGVGAAALGALAGCSAPLAETTRETSETHEAAPSVAVENVNGGVRVEPTDGSAVVVEATMRSVRGTSAFGEVSVDAERDGDTLRVEVTHDRQRVFPVTVDLRVRLPSGTDLDRVRTQNGSVRATNVAGDPELETSNGNVLATGIDGYLTARTTNGDVEAAGVAGVDGVSSTNGRVDVEIRSVRGDTAVQNTNGNVVVTLAPDLDARVVAETVNGSVSTTGLDLADVESSRRRVAGRMGDGDHELRVRTTNGDVRLEGQGQA